MEIFKQSRRDFFKLLSIVFGATSLCGIRALLAAAKEVYPAERITWIVPFKAGGGFDLIARSVAPYLTKYLRELSKEARGGEIVIKNVPEAGGARAYNNILQAKPNGYTIGDFNSGFFIENVISGHKIDCTKYTYLLRTGVSSRLIVVHTKGFKNWDEMMKAGKEKELKWAAGNFGGGAHVACILVKDTAKVPARLINFPGTAENANAFFAITRLP